MKTIVHKEGLSTQRESTFKVSKACEMLRVLFLITGLVFTSGMKAQEWFPQGASWYYGQIILLQGESYSYFEVTGEIVIQGKSCKIISGSCFCGVPGVGGFLYQEGDKIFAFDFNADTFRLLYDFSLVAGDTLIFKGDPAFGGDGIFLIDSVTIIQAGSEQLRVQHITHLNFDVVLGNKIIERIGSNGCLYPQVTFCDPSTGGLRCYEDDETGLLNFQTPPRPCDYVSTAVDDPSVLSLINVYPNPATSSVHIKTEKQMVELTLFNNLSIPVYQKSSIFNADYELDVWSLPAGLFHIKAVLSDHQIVHRSLVILK